MTTVTISSPTTDTSADLHVLLLYSINSSISLSFFFFVHLAQVVIRLVKLVRVLGDSALGGEVLVLPDEQHSDTPTNTSAE